MNLKFISISVFTFFILTQTASADGPSNAFGILQGQPMTQIEIAEKMGKNSYKLKTVPNPHELLTVYSAEVTESSGVCSVKGYLPVTEKHYVNSAYITIKDQIISKHGKSITLYTSMDRNVIISDVWAFTGSQKQR